MAEIRSTAEEEEEEGGGAAEATIVCPAVNLRPKVREGSMEAAGVGIRTTTAHLVARLIRLIHSTARA